MARETKWEYRVDVAPRGQQVEGHAEFFELLQDVGGEGWELVGFHADRAYFKRERRREKTGRAVGFP